MDLIPKDALVHAICCFFTRFLGAWRYHGKTRWLAVEGEMVKRRVTGVATTIRGELLLALSADLAEDLQAVSLVPVNLSYSDEGCAQKVLTS